MAGDNFVGVLPTRMAAPASELAVAEGGFRLTAIHRAGGTATTGPRCPTSTAGRE